MPLLTKYCLTRDVTRRSLFATAAFIAGSVFGPTMLIEWTLILPMKSTINRSVLDWKVTLKCMDMKRDVQELNKMWDSNEAPWRLGDIKTK